MAEFTKIDSDTMQITRTENAGMWQDYQFGKPNAYSVYFEDFYTYAAGDWTITETGNATQALTDAAYGVLLITNAAGIDDSSEAQSVAEVALPTAGKNIYYEIKVQISDATESDMLVGLAVTDTETIDGVTNGIYFKKDDGDTALDFETTSGSVSSTDSNIHTIVAATDLKLGFKVTGTGLVEYYVNDVLKGSFTTNIPTTELALIYAIQNGEAVAKTMAIDYINIAQER